MNQIDKLLSKHMCMKFPDFPERDDLAEWVENLAEVEGQFIGLVKSGKISKKHLDSLADFAGELNGLAVSKTDHNILQYCRQYIAVILDLVKLSLKN